MKPSPRSMCAVTLLAVLAAGCSEHDEPAGKAVRQAWSDGAKQAAVPPPTASAPDSPGESNKPKAIAYVNGQPVSRERVVNLLLAGHGVGVLEQIVVLERAKHMAAEQGIAVTPAAIEAEFLRSLRNLISPLEAADDDAAFDRDEAERVLDQVLARRNISREECMAVVTRNAYLRAIVDANLTFDETQLGEEYLRSFSKRSEIRHIQVAHLAEAERILALLRNGRDFSEIAGLYSANLRTAPAGGLLRPFSQNDTDVPPALREAAFKLDVGTISDPIRVDEWYHLIRVERLLPAEHRTPEELRPQLEKRLRRRLTAPAMQALYGTLFEQADLRIVDPVLDAEFQRKHPDRKKP